MITIRLDRVGVRRKPIYRVSVVEHTTKKGGKSLDVLGIWQPGKKLNILDKDRLDSWLKRGAKVSKAVSQLLSK